MWQLWQTYSSLLKGSTQGLSASEVAIRRGLFGQNLAEVPVKSHGQLLLDEVLHPFYIFQIWSVVVWYLEPYILYASTIAIISIISALFSLFSTRRNLLNMQAMAQFTCKVTVVRRRSDSTANIASPPQRLRVCSSQLVPGDVVIVDDHMVFPCDMVLCSGNVVVNEAMLTGESLPVLKTAIPVCHDTCYDAESDKRFTLFCGTKAMEARRMGGERVVGIVLRSGFDTAKGRLVRSILYPKPSSFKFYADSFKFVGVMAGFAILGFLWSIAAFVKYGVDVRDVILNACDVVTIAVPPALPAAMTIGTEFAIERLKACKIFCISPNRVNICGQLEMVCFDKTGTLTEEGVDVMGVLPCDTTGVSELAPVDQAPERLMQCLACCHALTQVKGELIGDPLDLKMFAATGWTLHEQPEDQRHDSVAPPRVCPPVPTPSASRASSMSGGFKGDQMRRNSHGSNISDGSNDPDVLAFEKRWAEKEGLAIIKKFDFTSNHQRMSVITRNDHDKGSHIFLKGAPEVVRDLCHASSIPHNFTQVVQGYTRQGLRLLACAHAYDASMTWHKAEKMPRDKAERGLVMVGILMLENRLKPETAPVMAELNRAGIRCCMVTGDHVLTAVTVSRHCGIIHPHRAVLISEVVPVSSHHHAHAMLIRHESNDSGHSRVSAAESNCSHPKMSVKSKSCVDLCHQGLQGMTARPNAGHAMVHTSQPSQDGSGSEGDRLLQEQAAAARSHATAAHEAAGGLEVQGGSLTLTDALWHASDTSPKSLFSPHASPLPSSPLHSTPSALHSTASGARPSWPAASATSAPHNGGGFLHALRGVSAEQDGGWQPAACDGASQPLACAPAGGAGVGRMKQKQEVPTTKMDQLTVRFRLLEPEKVLSRLVCGNQSHAPMPLPLPLPLPVSFSRGARRAVQRHGRWQG